MKSEEIIKKIFELEAELEETEINETIREEARKAAEALKSVRDEMIKAGLPEELVNELLLRSITINIGEDDENN